VPADRANRLLPATLDTTLPRRMFCFPHAGGGTAMFYRWQRYLPPDVALVPLRLPGREDRRDEPSYTSLDALAGDAAAAIAQLPPRPYVLVGHSLGGYVALEVAYRLLAHDQPPPAHLVVAACGAPRSHPSRQPIGHLPDEAFVDEVARRYDGIPLAVRNNPELLAMVLPALRADIQMIESYAAHPREPLPIDLLALGGTEDAGVSIDRLSAWREWTSANFSMRLLPGGHFFLHPLPRRAGSEATDVMPTPLVQIVGTLPPAGET